MGVAFRNYCARVESTADWGGHAELLALVHVLSKPIYVHSMDAPVLVMGEEYVGSALPLQVTYHKHQYALGEHYNSTAEASGVLVEAEAGK